MKLGGGSTKIRWKYREKRIEEWKLFFCFNMKWQLNIASPSLCFFLVVIGNEHSQIAATPIKEARRNNISHTHTRKHAHQDTSLQPLNFFVLFLPNLQMS